MARSTKTDRVYAQLADEIIEGGIKPGTKLIISHLAKQFEVSEIPIREAIQRLAQDGLVILKANSGSVVSSLSREDILNISEIRINLEGLATRLAIDNLSNNHFKELRNILNSSIACYKEGNQHEYPYWNRLFHESIYQHSNNARLITMISDLWNLSKRYPNMFVDKESMKLSIKEHEQILEALMSGDSDLAEKLMIQHKKRGFQQVIELAKELNEDEMGIEEEEMI